ncbi:MAG TPA: hypothetical protein VFL57_19255, partial [Bryobacteraceae bacterium]|nr:hypothetical protein [Bryobacteraceae bacterium]
MNGKGKANGAVLLIGLLLFVPFTACAAMSCVSAEPAHPCCPADTPDTGFSQCCVAAYAAPEILTMPARSPIQPAAIDLSSAQLPVVAHSPAVDVLCPREDRT